MKNKFILFALLLCMVFCFTACGMDDWEDEDYDDNGYSDTYSGYDDSDDYGILDAITDIFSDTDDYGDYDSYNDNGYDDYGYDDYRYDDDYGIFDLLGDLLGLGDDYDSYSDYGDYGDYESYVDTIQSAGKIDTGKTVDLINGSAVSGTPAKDSWIIYWYLCGSDLESEYGCATTDLNEMMQVTLPENVTVLIQTGGASSWQNSIMSNRELGRYAYIGDQLYQVGTAPSASMGDPQTLYDFIAFGDANFSAEHKALIFWNHGGGSLSGAAFDEIYNSDSINLNELKNVLYSLYGKTSTNKDPEFDVIGFDTCLMATVDVANVVKDYAGYLVASEETEPGCGWYYCGWLGDLAKKPSMNGAELGKSICDNFVTGCKKDRSETEITLSVTDLSKVPALLDAYNAYGEECLALASQDNNFFKKFYQSASNSENYGGNTRQDGYTDMVDLGHLARNTASYISSSAQVSKALNDAIVYKINGKYRAEATGLSCFYTYDNSKDSLAAYGAVGAGVPFVHLFTYALTGQLYDASASYLNNLDITGMQELDTLDDVEVVDAQFGYDENGSVYMCLSPEVVDSISEISYYLFDVEEEQDFMLFLGEDDNITCDWENGIFTENFYGTWGCINDYPVYMERIYGDDSYNLYSVPILLNGEDYNLQVAYNFYDGEYHILGAKQSIDNKGMASKELRQLQYDDKIDIIWMISDYESDEDFQPYAVESFTVDEDFAFTEGYLPDGTYGMVYILRDAFGNERLTDAIAFDVIEGEIFTYISD